MTSLEEEEYGTRGGSDELTLTFPPTFSRMQPDCVTVNFATVSENFVKLVHFIYEGISDQN